VTKIISDKPTVYWGTQSLDEMPDVVQHRAFESPQYIDLTAGGAQIPLHYARHGIAVGVNDRNPYAHYGHKASMQATPDDANYTEPMLRTAYAEVLLGIDPVEGWTTRNSQLAAIAPISICRHIDGIVRIHPEFAAAVGRTLVKYYRADDKRSWTPTWTESLTTFKTQVVESLVEQWKMRVSLLTASPVQCTNADADDALDEMHIVPGAMCYIDPAWPWQKQYVADDAVNPYEFYTYEVGGIVTQKDVPHIDFWSNDDDTTPMRDVASWIGKAFDRGAGSFCVSTQSTNSPDPEEVFDYLEHERGFKRVAHDTREAHSSWDGQTYTDMFTIYEA